MNDQDDERPAEPGGDPIPPTTPQPTRLPVWATVKEAYAVWFANPGLWLKLAIVPVVCLIGLSVLGQTNFELRPGANTQGGVLPTPGVFFLGVAIYLSQVPFVTAWHRIILMPQVAAAHRYRIGNREGRYLLHVFIVVMAIIIFLTLASYLTGLILSAFVGTGGGGFDRVASLLGFAAMCLVLGYFLVGVFLILPAAAVGREIQIGQAVRASSGNQWRLLGIYAVALLPVWGLAVIIEQFTGATATDSLVVQNALYFGPELLFAPTIIGVLSITYRELVQKPAAESGFESEDV